MDRSGNKNSSSRSSFELLQVSKETQKINQMIDSWSKGENIDEQSKNIAQDLLKSALKLQKSMIMLSRLQEASNFMAQTKKARSKPSETYAKECNTDPDKKFSVNASEFRSRYPLSHTKFSVRGSSLTYSDEAYRNGLSSQELPSSRECPLQRSGNQKQKNDSGSFQNPNYGRNSEGDVNKMNKDSLFKHKLLSILCDENENNRRKSKCNVFPEESLSLETSLPNSSESEKTRQPMKTSKAPNLIAKLMGLEEIPEEAFFKSSTQEHEINNKSYYHPKPVSDIQMPKVLNLKSDGATYQKMKASKEKIDDMKFQGLLRTTPREHSEYLRRVHDRAEEFPPIMIIESLADLSHEGEVDQSFTNLIPRKSKYSPVQKSVSNEMEGAGDRALNSVIQKTSSQFHVEQQMIKPAPRKCANARKGLKDQEKMMEEHNQKFYQVMTPQIKNKDKVQSRKCASEMSVDQTPRIEMDDGNEDLQSRSSAENSISRGKIQRENGRKLNMTQEYTNLRSTMMTLSTDAVVHRKGQDGFRSPTRDSLGVCGKFPVKAGAPRQTVGLCRTSANNHFDHSKTTIDLTTDSCRQNLLLSSPLFLGKMEKQFGLIIQNSFQPLFSNHVKNNTDGIGTLLSCANELLERKYCEMAFVCHPLLQTHLRCKYATSSLESLMDEVISGIDSLRNYRKVDTHTCQTDMIFSILGKDLMCRNMVVNGVWDRSWLDGFSIEETEVVVNEIGMAILGWMIEEAVITLAMQILPSRLIFH